MSYRARLSAFALLLTLSACGGSSGSPDVDNADTKGVDSVQPKDVAVEDGVAVDDTVSVLDTAADTATSPDAADVVPGDVGPEDCDANPCAHGTCVDDATAGFVCTCSDGWTGTRCDADVDECAAETDACDDNATCLNAAGSYRCFCRGGFVGDGRSCIDVDECLFQPCGVDEVCTNTDGAYTCDCADGFARDTDGICADIDECLDSTLCTGAGVSCLNGPGGYDCVYTGCGDTCPIPALCLQFQDNICPAPTTCRQEPVDSPDSWTCECSTGYENGPGGGCFDIDECTRQILVPKPNSRCVNTPGSARIECLTGYRDVAGVCVDVDECAEGIFTCAAEGAICKNLIGSAYCACGPGFVGNGTSCADIDECAADVPPCHGLATCANTTGSFECTCNDGTFGDGLRCGVAAESADLCSASADFVSEAPSHCLCAAGLAGDGLECRFDVPLGGAYTDLTLWFDDALPGGSYRFYNIHIKPGATLGVIDNGILDLRAAGDIIVEGAINVSGEAATNTWLDSGTGGRKYVGAPSGLGQVGANGRPVTVGSGWNRRILTPLGGFYGGGGGAVGSSARGGAGGGGYAGGGGGGTAGVEEPTATGASGAGGAIGVTNGGRSGGAPYDGAHSSGTFFVSGGGGGIGEAAARDLAVLRTLQPGSGGGGGAIFRDTTFAVAGNGGGGGGAVRLVSGTKIVISGQVLAKGGQGMSGGSLFTASGGGSGGLVFLAAPIVEVTGRVDASGGPGGIQDASFVGTIGDGGDGGLGRIRIAVNPGTCDLSGTLVPPPANGCAVSPVAGTPGKAYIGPWGD